LPTPKKTTHETHHDVRFEARTVFALFKGEQYADCAARLNDTVVARLNVGGPCRAVLARTLICIQQPFTPEGVSDVS
jgi:hypothetical protein